MLSARHDLVVGLSERRARIATDRPLPAGTAVFLEFADGACVDAIATDGGDASGFVVEFVAVDPLAAEIMARALRPVPPRIDMPTTPVGPVAVSPQVAAFLSDRADVADPALQVGPVVASGPVDGAAAAPGDGADADADDDDIDVVDTAFAAVEQPLPRTRTDELFVGMVAPASTALMNPDEGPLPTLPTALPARTKTTPAALASFEAPPVTVVPAEPPPGPGETWSLPPDAALVEAAPLAHTATLTPMTAPVAGDDEGAAPVQTASSSTRPVPGTDDVTGPHASAGAGARPDSAPAVADDFAAGFDVPFTGSFAAAPLLAGLANEAPSSGIDEESVVLTAATTTTPAPPSALQGASWSPRSLNTDIGEDDASPVEQTQRWPTARVAEVVTTSLLPLSVTPTPGVPTLSVTADQGRRPTPTPAPVSRPPAEGDDEKVEQTQRWPVARAKLREVVAGEAHVDAVAVPTAVATVASAPPVNDDAMVESAASATSVTTATTDLVPGSEEVAGLPPSPTGLAGDVVDNFDEAFGDAFGDVDLEEVGAPASTATAADGVVALAPTSPPATAHGAPVAVVDEAIDITMEFTGARPRVAMPASRPLPDPDGGGVIDVDFSEFADVLGVATFKSEAPPLVTPSTTSRIATPHPVSVSLPRTPSSMSPALQAPPVTDRNPFAGDSGKRALADSSPPTTPSTMPPTSLEELWVASSPQTTLPTSRLLDEDLAPVLRTGGRNSTSARTPAPGESTPWTVGRDSSTPQALPFVGDTPAPAPAPPPLPRPPAAPGPPGAPAGSAASAAPTLPWAARSGAPPVAPPPLAPAPPAWPPASGPAWPSPTPAASPWPVVSADPFAGLAPPPIALGNRVTPTGPTTGVVVGAGGTGGAQVLPLSPSSEGLPLIVGDDDDDIPVVLGGETFDIDDDNDNSRR